MEAEGVKTSYFSFGQTHVHSVNGRTFDKDDIVKITHLQPRQRMMGLFGPKWAFEYTEEEFARIDPRHYPKGVTELQ